jgi:hypothetical protein
MTSLNRTTDNPFSAQRIRPGAIDFLFGEGESLAQCLARLAEHGGWGQIRGPHGSGKSTLLAELTARLKDAPRRIEAFTLHDGERRLPATPGQMRSWDERVQVAIDGFEQLSFVNRWRVKRLCRRQGCGLLATTHRDLGLPDIYVTRPAPEVARRVAQRLLEGWPDLVTEDDINHAFTSAGGDIRETLFALYDLYEERRTGAG